CTFLSKKIYCYGGLIDGEEDVSMVMLDIFNNSGSTAEEMKGKWAIIYPNTPADLNARQYPQHMQTDDKTLLISGGNNKATTRLTAQTATYNSETNSWKEYPEYQEGSYGNRQIYHASSVYVPNLGVGFYGGIEAKYLDNWTYQDVNVTKYEIKSSRMRYIGYPRLTFLDIEDPINPWSVYPVQNNIPAIFSFYQTSIYDDKSKRIFFFGGRYTDLVNFGQYDHTFDNSITFNLTDGTWGSQNMSGNTRPNRRIHHTTNIALPDYCYVLNLDTYQWKQHNFEKLNAALVRTKHSAVAISKETLFIVFGQDINNEPTLSLLMLDVKNPSNITLMDKYVDPAAIALSPSSNSTLSSAKETEDVKLSTGATAGIAVGASVAGIIAIAAIVFCVLKMRKTIMKESESDRKENFEEPVMEVNWDEIDNNYVEVPTNPISNYGHRNQFKYPSQLADDKSLLADESTTIQSEGIPEKNRDASTHQRPDAIDNDNAVLYNRSHSTALPKPDGA
ncbi:uncharacterized protein EV154DRAFT_492872, partial [Mucor mucedo]|uniref:uncharacterized protein n=1 Tax=Mucor mucedo TaxID=29922 RepID=UPI00221F8911